MDSLGIPIFVTKYSSQSLTVSSLKYENKYGKFDWSYEVRLDRKSKSDNYIFLYVGDSNIMTRRAK